MPARWSFVSNHLLVLSALVENPDVRQRDIAKSLGITQGAVQRILHDLIEGGHVEADRIGRRNHYRVNHHAGMRHPLLKHVPAAQLIKSLENQPINLLADVIVDDSRDAALVPDEAYPLRVF